MPTPGPSTPEALTDYAAAGSPKYWILDLGNGVPINVFEHLDGRDEPVVRVELGQPVPLTLDLDALIP